MPKEIIFLDKLPLTAVGKPIKHALVVDAARRVFSHALQQVPQPWTLEVIHTGGSGLKITLHMPNATSAAREQAEGILSAYSVPYSIKQA